MKKPKPTLLYSETIQQLKDDGLDPLYIEFFGTVSGMAKAINNPYSGQRCIKAALTLLSRPRTVEMFRAWTEKRFHPERTTDTSAADSALHEAKLEQEALERDRAEQWQEKHLLPGFNGPEDDDEEEDE